MMNLINTYIVNPRSTKTRFHCYDIEPEEVTVSVLIGIHGDGHEDYCVIDEVNHVFYPAAADNAVHAIHDYIDYIYGRVTGVDEEGNEEEVWASDTVWVTRIGDEWEVVGEE